MTTPRRGRLRGQQGLLTILFTDLEASTAMTQRLGDARAQEIVRAHNTIVRREVSARGGTDVKHTGDGIMATFPSAARAVAAAVAMQEASRAYNEAHPETAFNIAVGLNAGEPVAEDADVFGSAVQLAKRTCDEARGGQILATNVVRELVFGKGALFADAGTAELKGFDEPVHRFEVSAGAAGIDEGERAAARGFPVRLLAAGTLVGAVAAAGAVAGAFVLSGDDSGETAEPDYREIRVRSNENNQPFEITGDCINTPVVLMGRGDGAFSGDISGFSTAAYEARYTLDDDCTSLTVSAITTSELDNGSTYTAVSRGMSLNVIGQITPGSVTSQADIVLATIVTGGTGAYAGVAGRGSCDVSALRNQASGQEGISYQTECLYKLAPISSLPPVIVEAIANAEGVTTQLSPSGRGDTFKLMLLYFNTREEPQTGLSVRLPVPAGGQIASSAGDDRTPIEGPRQWALPDLAPGATAAFEITVRLLAAEGESITLLPEIAQTGRKQAMKPDPIVIEVER